jgi:hypothetical protein
MKKFGLNTLVIGVLSFISGWLGWWEWDFVVIAFLVAFIVNDTSVKSSAAALLVISTIWIAVAMMNMIGNEMRLVNMVKGIVNISSANILLFITVTIGGLVAGFAAMTGSLARDAFLPNRNRKGERI